jgi:hypothetical protein
MKHWRGRARQAWRGKKEEAGCNKQKNGEGTYRGERGEHRADEVEDDFTTANAKAAEPQQEEWE